MAVAAENTGPAWLQRDRQVIEGLDQLGIQVVSINIYASLLPGITNVTDRARYYAFYPWVLHRYANRGSEGSSKVEWRTWIRRLDYAYALASALNEKAHPDAGTAVVGINTARERLRNKSDDESINVAAGAAVDPKGKIGAGTYFQNSEGGLGQYYKGVMRALGISADQPEFSFPDWAITPDVGRPLAEYLDAQPDFQQLLEVANRGGATVRELRAIGAAINPAAIPAGSSEQQLLRHLFFGTDEAVCRGQASELLNWRRSSLRLLLEFADSAGGTALTFIDDFRWTVMEGRLTDGQPWSASAAQENVRAAWGAYQRNDLMNYALEAFFWVALRQMEQTRLTPRDLSLSVAELTLQNLAKPMDGAGSLPSTPTIADLLEMHGPDYDPRVPDRNNAGSTRAWSEKLATAIKAGDDEAASAIAFRILARLAADSRIDRACPLGRSPAITHIMNVYEVHLGTWVQRCAERSSEPAQEFLAELIQEWILYRHLRVATRKLAGQGVSTFKFRPDEGRLVFIGDEPTTPVFTNPRLRQTIQILKDLGFLSSSKSRISLTADGASMLESFRD